MDFRDLINETLLIAFEKFETLKSSDAFLSFLFGISVRILANKNRKNKEDELKEDKVLFLIKDQHADSSKSTDIYFLHQALAQLSEDQREAIILFEITGFSIKEITEIQQVSESAVKQRLKRGREKLTEILTFESSLKTGEVQHG
jgi:RNA polymerase sigma-70 factor (ECF subfamily)